MSTNSEFDDVGLGCRLWVSTDLKGRAGAVASPWMHLITAYRPEPLPGGQRFRAKLSIAPLFQEVCMESR